MNDREYDLLPLVEVADLAKTPIRGYVRERHVIAEIVELRSRQRSRWVREASERSPEAVVHLIRLARSGPDEDLAWRLIEDLLARIARYVTRRLSKWVSLSSADRDDAMSALTCRVAEEWRSLDAQHEFWEARFWPCLSRRLLDCVKSTAPWIAGNGERAHGLGGDEDERDTFIDTAGPSVEDRAVALAALAQLPAEMRRIVWLKYQDGLTDDQIGELLGVTGRTVRNHLARARKFLADDVEGSEPT